MSNQKHTKTAESIVKEIKRKTRRKFSSEEKIRIIIEGLRGEDSITAICRREGINPNLVLPVGVKISWRPVKSVYKAIQERRLSPMRGGYTK